MTEQTPNHDEPTQPIQPTSGGTPEGTGSAAGEGSATPPPTTDPAHAEGAPDADHPAGATTYGDGSTPPPPPADGTTAYGDGTPPPPAKKSRTGLIIGLVAGVVVLLVIVGVVLALTVFKGEDKHSIATPTKAGSMTRDSAQEKTLQQQLDAAEQQFKSQAKNITYVKSAVYKQADTKRGPAGGLVFLGAKLGKVQNPATFVTSFTSQATTNGFKVSNVSPGDGGGKAVCASQEAQGQKVAICAWATTDTVGEIVPTVPGYESAPLATIMRDLRKDVETTD